MKTLWSRCIEILFHQQKRRGHSKGHTFRGPRRISRQHQRHISMPSNGSFKRPESANDVDTRRASGQTIFHKPTIDIYKAFVTG